MPHEIEMVTNAEGQQEAALMLGGGEGAWHTLGNVIGADVTDKHDAMKQSHTGWRVETVPFFTEPHAGHENQDDLVHVPGFKAVRRESDGAFFGVVGDSYTPFQNEELFDLMSAVVGDQVAFHTAGSLYGGRKVFVSCKFREDLMIAGEDYERYLVGFNGHDGTRGLSVYPTGVRTVCANTANYGESLAERNGSIFWAKHTPSITDLAKNVDAFWRKLVPFVAAPGDTEEVRTLNAQRKLKVDELRLMLDRTYKTADDLAAIRGTRWGVFQAITDVDSHQMRPRQGAEQRFERLVAGNGSTGLVKKAMPLLLAGV
jgi:hypothetical protein